MRTSINKQTLDYLLQHNLINRFDYGGPYIDFNNLTNDYDGNPYNFNINSFSEITEILYFCVQTGYFAIRCLDVSSVLLYTFFSILFLHQLKFFLFSCCIQFFSCQ